ncbi:MAG: hypothetical protein IJH69_06550, partial [Firmicutes bacterium]|nr:hypothetical protein [Bacillota bacterium]
QMLYWMEMLVPTQEKEQNRILLIFSKKLTKIFKKFTGVSIKQEGGLSPLLSHHREYRSVPGSFNS